MTREETRKLGIEFERRLIEVYPQFASEEKLQYRYNIFILKRVLDTVCKNAVF